MDVDPTEYPSRFAGVGRNYTATQHPSHMASHQQSHPTLPLPTPTMAPYSFSTPVFQPLLTPYSTAESAPTTTPNYIFYNPNVQAQPHTVSPLIVPSQFRPANVPHSTGDATKDKQVYKMAPAARQHPESPLSAGLSTGHNFLLASPPIQENSELPPTKAVAPKINKPTYVLKSPVSQPLIPTQQPPLIYAPSSAAAPTTSTNSTRIPSVSSPKIPSVGSPVTQAQTQAAPSSAAPAPVSKTTRPITKAPAPSVTPTITYEPPTVPAPYVPPPVPSPQPSLVVTFDDDESDDEGYVPEVPIGIPTTESLLPHVVEHYKQIIAEKEQQKKPDNPPTTSPTATTAVASTSSTGGSHKIKLGPSTSVSPIATVANQTEIERLKQLIKEKEALKKKKGNTTKPATTTPPSAATTPTPTAATQAPTTSKTSSSSVQGEPVSKKQKTAHQTAPSVKATPPAPPQLELSPVNTGGGAAHGVVPSVASPPSVTATTSILSPPPVPASNNLVAGLAAQLEVLQKLVSEQEVALQVCSVAVLSWSLFVELCRVIGLVSYYCAQTKNKEVTDQENRLLTLKSDLTSTENKKYVTQTLTSGFHESTTGRLELFQSRRSGLEMSWHSSFYAQFA